MLHLIVGICDGWLLESRINKNRYRGEEKKRERQTDKKRQKDNKKQNKEQRNEKETEII